MGLIWGGSEEEREGVEEREGAGSLRVGKQREQKERLPPLLLIST